MQGLLDLMSATPPPPSPSSPPPPASSLWQCSLPDLNGKFPTAVFPPRPQLQAPDRQCSHPNLKRQSVFTDLDRTSRRQHFLLHPQLSEFMSGGMSNFCRMEFHNQCDIHVRIYVRWNVTMFARWNVKIYVK